MPAAARKLDWTSHGPVLYPGPGSPDVNIGYAPAWRALPNGVGAGVEAASGAMKALMDSPALTPPQATVLLATVEVGLNASAGAAAGSGNGAAGAGVGTAMATMNGANAALTAAYTTASAAPGGQPAATQAYTEGIKAAAGGAASAAVGAIAAGIADIHNCTITSGPVPHGLGVVTRGCATVFINKLPASRKGDNVVEAAGGSDPISVGCYSVNIGDLAGGGGGGGGASGWLPADTESSDNEDTSGAQDESPSSGPARGAGSPSSQGGGPWQQPPLSDESTSAYFGEDPSEDEGEEMVMDGSEKDGKSPSLPPGWEPCREKTWWDDVKDWASGLFDDDDGASQKTTPNVPEQPEPFDPNDHSGESEDEGEWADEEIQT